LSLVIGSLLLASAHALTVYVPASQELCYFERAERGEKVVSSFNVAAGGFLDIDIKVFGPDNKIIYEADREKEGSFQFIATQSGEHRLCFGNQMSTVTGKTVSFHLYVGNALAQHHAAKKEHLTPLEGSILKLSENLHQVRDSQEYIKVRERACRSTSESTNERVMWWSIVESLALVMMAVFQIYWLRRFFERKQTK